jgi:hypothetical protein
VRGDLYRGVVTRATADGIWVKVPSRWRKVEFGPLPHVFAGIVTEGERVLVADTGTQDFIIVGVIKKGVA